MSGSIVTVNGFKVPAGPRPVSAQEISAGLDAELMVPYEGTDPNKIGLTKIQAALRSFADRLSEGDADAFTELLNRKLGKPVQSVQTLSLTASLKDFLNQLDVPTATTQEDPFGD
jgi:hypothetical protein